MEENYNEDYLNELINWFNGKDLPESLQINDAIYSPDLKGTIHRISEQARNTHHNPTYHGNFRQLEEIKAKLEDMN